MENNVEVPQEIQNRAIIWCNNSTSGYLTEEMKTLSLKDVFTHIFTVALSAVAQICKQFKCPSVDGGIKKSMVCVHTHTHSLENYSAIIKEVNPAICNKWMDLEGIVLSETSQVEKDKC